MADKRRFVIKPFRPHCQMDEEQAGKIWDSLRRAIDEIYNKNASVLSFEELYRNAYNLVLHKHGDLLYEGVQKCVEERLAGVAANVAAAADDDLLAHISQHWEEHKVTMVMVRDILMYMDRTYVPQNKKMAVYDLGLFVFRDTVARHKEVRERLRCLLLENVRLERTGRLMDHGLMKSTLHMLADLGIETASVYEEDFEAYFLEETRQFYRAESSLYLAENAAPEYLCKVERRIAEELERVENYLHTSTRAKLQHIVESELISAHAKTLVETERQGFGCLLLDNKLEDLRRMYALFARAPATLAMLRAALYEHAKDAGHELVAEQDRRVPREPVEFLKGLLALREKYDAVVKDAFRGENLAQKRLKEAFESFINADARCAACLVVYIDELMRSGFKGATEADVESKLDDVIVIFRYLQDKDVFENFYKSHLAKRLLNGRSLSHEAERSMLAKLKAECGCQFTTKLEGMFTDIKFSRDSMEKYANHERVALAVAPAFELDVTMLTAGYWPMATTLPCVMPAAVMQRLEPFETFYLRQHTGRKLTWQTSCGTAELKATFDGARKNKHELTVSTYQMCILLLFNVADDTAEPARFSLAEIADATRIPAAELKRHIVSLCTPKHRILLKKSKGKGVAEDDSFVVNTAFSSKLKRVRVPLVAMKEAGGGLGGTDLSLIPEAVEEDRRHLAEATIVRVMKARKQMKHNDLIAEVTRQLSSRFVPQSQFIKKCIESLLEREYVERSQSDARLYTYLA